MAGVFDTYRHHKKFIFWMILLAMVLFMVGGSLLGRGGGGAGGTVEDPVVATWTFGKIYVSDLRRVAEQQTMLRNFFFIALGGEYRGPAVTQAEALNEIILAKKAQQMGIVMSDDVIKDELRADIVRTINPNGFRDIESKLNYYHLLTEKGYRAEQYPDSLLKAAQERSHLGQDQLFAIERRKAMARRVTGLFQQGAQQVPPGEIWDNFLRENRHVKAEIVALQVDDYISRVPDPSEDQLKRFYDNHKDALPQDGEPGFKLPYRASFQYFVADASYKKRAEADVTDDQIKHFYDTHTDLFEEKETDKKDGEKKDTEKKDTDKKDTEKKDADKTGDAKDEKSAEPKSEEKKEGVKDGDKPEASPEAKKDSPATDKNADKKTADPKATDKATDKTVDPKVKDKKTGASRLPSSGALAAFNVADELQLAAAPTGKKAPPPAPDVKKADPVKPADKATTAAPKDDKGPAADKTADKGADKTLDKQPDAKSADDKNGADDKKAAFDKNFSGDDVKLTAHKYKPLADVKEQIRGILATGPAEKAAREALDAAAVEVTAYGAERTLWRSKMKQPDAKVVEPPPANFAEIAKAHGLTLHNTGLKSRVELAKTSELRAAYFRGEQNSVPFLDKVFPGLMVEYRPQLAEDLGGDMLMIWLDDEQPGKIPEYDKIKVEVKQAWKTMEARKLAMEEAERLAKVAKKDAQAPLKESLGKEGKDVVAIGPFTWKVRKFDDSVANDTIRAVADAGDEFMRAVYSLEVGGIGTAWNQPKSDAYVVRVDEWTPSMSNLFTEFESDPKKASYRDSATLPTMGRRWLDSLKEEFKFQTVKGVAKTTEPQDFSGSSQDDEG